MSTPMSTTPLKKSVSKMNLRDDGRIDVTTTVDSAQTAAALSGEHERFVRQAEKRMGARFNARLKAWLDWFDETIGLYADRVLDIIGNGLLLCGIGLAIFAWQFVLPGYEALMCLIGALIVFAVSVAAARLDAEWLKPGKAVPRPPRRDGTARPDRITGAHGIFGWLVAVIVIGTPIDMAASASLQALVGHERATGVKEIDKDIAALEEEQSRLQIVAANNPQETSAKRREMINGYLQTPMVTRDGTQLTRTVGELLADTECDATTEGGKKNRFYVGVYCPTYREYTAKLETDAAYERALARLHDIPGEIAAKRAQRPHESSTFALGDLATGGGQWWGPLVVPVVLTFLLMSLMVLVKYLAGRAKRTPVIPDPPAAATPPAAPQIPAPPAPAAP